MSEEQSTPNLSSIGREIAPDLADNRLETYARLWQFETWLRRVVYVELRAQLGDDWKGIFRGTDRSREADLELTHMPTPETDPGSYCQLSELSRIIMDRWGLFETYLPPKDLWDAKIREISQIRHRVAHFRIGHTDDLQRVVQLLRDLDQGFWRFCTSYNNPQPVLPPSDDPVTAKFLGLDPFPWSQAPDRSWVRVGSADPEARFAVTVEVLHRPWVNAADEVSGSPGRFYDFCISGRHNRGFDYRRFLQDSSGFHTHVAHICLDSSGSCIRVTIPAVLGADRVTEVAGGLIERCQACLCLNVEPRHSDGWINRLAAEWPEYVLGPDNPLTFLSPDTPCSFFGV